MDGLTYVTEIAKIVSVYWRSEIVCLIATRTRVSSMCMCVVCVYVTLDQID